MTRRAARRLAVATCALTLVLISGIGVMTFLNRGDIYDVNFTIVGVSSAIVGGVVASRQVTNPVGWLFLGSALSAALRELAGAYAVYGIITNPGALPLPYAAAWLSNAVVLIGPVMSFVLIPLYFPNGKPVSRRWSLVAWIALVSLPVITLLYALAPGEAVNGSGIQNPLGVEALRPVMEGFQSIALVWYIGLILAAAASLVVRFRRSVGEERLQLKWFTFAAAFIPVWFLVNSPIEAAIPNLFALLDSLIIAAVPIAAGIAILRYRLYDIDLIINRTLVYGALTLFLALIYFGGVVVVQAALRAVSGQESSLAVVASTLMIAALFTPLRRRIQSFIDRRFYRRKYDAARTLEEFGSHLREETDLDRLGEELVSVVRETVQPEHASLWLRPQQSSFDWREGGSRGV
ncbi:MAG TPA: hypothetical protein VHM69_14135 [Rubrobacter sp.]|nr:hypothetical protein [Rubrobacter sp.]